MQSVAGLLLIKPSHACISPLVQDSRVQLIKSTPSHALWHNALKRLVAGQVKEIQMLQNQESTKE